MKNHLHRYPDEATLHQLPPHQGAVVAVNGRIGRYVGRTGPHLWVAWTLNKKVYQMMRTVLETVVERGNRLTPLQPAHNI